MRCFECRYLDISKVLTCYPPKYYCTYDKTTHFADDECKYERYPIVRCKDCEYADFNSPYPVCNLLEMNINEDGYCSWVKIKGGDDKETEEAKEILTHNWTRVDNPNYSESELDEAFFMAIEALQTLEAVKKIRTEVLPQTEVYEDYEHATLVDIKEPLVKHDREWIIGCIKHDGFIKTDRFDKANQIILEALSADTVSREEYEEVKAYMDTLVDAFIEDGEELAESVKVVRCKDCRHANECHKSVQYTRNEQSTITIGYTPIEWCSRGERREPHGFTADEWYRDNFGENDGK